MLRKPKLIKAPGYTGPERRSGKDRRRSLETRVQLPQGKAFVPSWPSPEVSTRKQLGKAGKYMLDHEITDASGKVFEGFPAYADLRSGKDRRKKP